MIALLKSVFCTLALSLNLNAPCGVHVDRVNTPLTQNQLLEALSESHRAVFGVTPTATRLSMAWAQVSFENGRGALVFNNNLGNIGTSHQPRRPFYKLAGSKFKSFPDPIMGGKAYWNTLRNRCPSALSHFDSGDTLSVAIYLDKCGYYRTDIETYRKNIASLFNEAQKMPSW